MGTAAVGQINLALEPLTAQGVQAVLPNTVLAATINTGITQPATNVAGYHLELTVLANTVTGAITITGTNAAGGAITEVTPTIPIPPVDGQSPELECFKYVTAQAFYSLTSLTVPGGMVAGGGLARVGAMVYGKYLLPSEFKYDDKRGEYSPNEHRGFSARHTNIQHLTIEEGGDITQSLYPETSLWIAYLLFGNPASIDTASNTSTTLLKSAATSSPITLTTGPGPDSTIQFVISSSVAIGVITVTGKNYAGATITEAVAANGSNGNGTFVTVNTYWSITSITYTGLGSASIDINAINGPNSLLLATSVIATMTLTTPPLAPGQQLIFVVAGTAVAGTITIVGTNPRGQAITEVITVPATGAGNYYTSNIFATVTTSQFTTTGMTAGTIAVYSTFGWIYKWNDIVNATTFRTACLEFFSGTDSRIYPFTFLEEAGIDFTTLKETIATLKWRAQDGVPVGDRTTTPMTTNQIAALPQPPDQPIVGWQSLAWLDSIGTTPKTTAYNNLLECKLAVKVPKEPIYPALNTQRYAAVYFKKEGRDFDIEAKVDYKDVVLYEAFRQNQKKTFVFGLYGPVMGFVGTSMVQKAWEWTMNGRFHGDGVKPESTPAMANVPATYKLLGEYDAASGYTLQLTVTNQQPPVFPN